MQSTQKSKRKLRSVPLLTKEAKQMWQAVAQIGITPEINARKNYENKAKVLNQNKKALKKYLNQLRAIGFIQSYSFDKFNTPTLFASSTTEKKLDLDDNKLETYLISSALWFTMWDLLRENPQNTKQIDHEIISIIIFYTHNYVSHPTLSEEMKKHLLDLRVVAEKNKLDKKIKIPNQSTQVMKL